MRDGALRIVRPGPFWTGLLILILSLGVGLVPGAWADEETPEAGKVKTQDRPAAALQAVASPGLKAYIDPQTGQLTSRPTPEQIRTLSQALAFSLRPAEPMESFALPGGGTGVALHGHFMAATVVRVRQDGSHELGCATDSHALATALEAKPRPRPKVEIK